MNQTNTIEAHNPLETESIGKLMRQFAIPAIISGLMNSIYNIVDQIFIGQSVGTLGNAATNVAFPLVTIMASLSMMIGVGGASNFSLYLGKNENEKAAKVSVRKRGKSDFQTLLPLFLCFGSFRAAKRRKDKQW